MNRSVQRNATGKRTRPAAPPPPSEAGAGEKPRPAASGARAQTASRARAKIRMYCHGLGDCFLVTLPRDDGKENDAFRIMIDCGVILGTENAEGRMARVVDDIADVTGGRVDLLVVTHEHWDHVSGFLQAEAALRRIHFDAVWMGWTESPTDPQAQRLGAQRTRALEGLRLAEGRMRLAGATEAANEVSGLVDFFGAAGRGRSSRDALQAARALAPPAQGVRYAEPGEPPTPLPGTGAWLYVLGPPRNEQLLFRSDPSQRTPETYNFGFAGFSLDEATTCLDIPAPQGPFSPRMSIPLPVARAMPEFRRYWADGAAGAGEGESWRRIDSAWLDGAPDLALKLDHDTNNTSLVIAVELADGDVMLFAADAQVGNWLSWQTLEWSVAGRTVTGPELLARTVFYKVGHHGSHNATLRQKGLEAMERLQFAAIPVDEKTAGKRGWHRMPLPGLVAELQAKTGGRVLRSDAQPPAASLDGLVVHELYFELAL